MTGKQISIYLPEPEARALINLAANECRRPNEQARHILRQALLGNSKTADSNCEVSQAKQLRSGFAEVVVNS